MEEDGTAALAEGLVAPPAGEVAAGTADGVKVSADRFSRQALLAESASLELLGALALTVALPAKSQAWALYFEKT